LVINQLLRWFPGTSVEVEVVELDMSLGDDATETTYDDWREKKGTGEKRREERREKKEGRDSQTPVVGVVTSGSLLSIDGRTVTGISTDGDAGICISSSARICAAADWSACCPSERTPCN
jgi:hypothetical protein